MLRNYALKRGILRPLAARCCRYSSSVALDRYDNSYTTVVFDQEHSVQFNNAFLRDSCKAPESVDPFSSQKLFTTAEIAKNLTVNSPPVIKENDNESVLKIEWNQNGKISRSEYPESFLRKFINSESREKGKFFPADRTPWHNKELVENIDSLQVEYSEYFDDKTFFKTLSNLNRYGLSFVNSIPNPTETSGLEKMNEENAYQWPVAKLADRFGYIKKTFYGTLFDVKNEKEEAKNIANTNTFLPLHMDLLYYESPPGLQLLHFIQNSTLGGENVFCDSFLAAEHVKKVDPQAYLALKIVPVTYHYDNNNEYYFYKRPVVVEDEGKIVTVNYAPPFQGPFEFGVTNNDSHKTDLDLAKDAAEASLFQDFIRGFQLFEDFINDPQNHYQVKMPEGACVIFDNRRVLHSRLEFSDENGGDRWLMGTYVDGDSFRSKLRMGYRKFT
ncbi:gamma-butyrobetaine dioxygenase [Scheffersomyces xylosifermentans]|uniref:gamma-butyrobetaine dioxygenase n=1 Tax=Scheffersomyces xylosifermentans TaxID=1304137 RepID=UPI00315DC83C